MGPGTLLLLATLATVAGLSQIQQGVQAERQARRDARTLEDRGEEAARQRRREARRLLARQRVAFAASGVDPAGSGPVDLLADTAAREEMAAQLTAFPFLAESARIRFLGRQQRDAAIVSGVTTILGAGLQGGSGGFGGGAGGGSAFGGGTSSALTPVGSSPSGGVA